MSIHSGLKIKSGFTWFDRFLVLGGIVLQLFVLAQLHEYKRSFGAGGEAVRAKTDSVVTDRDRPLSGSGNAIGRKREMALRREPPPAAREAPPDPALMVLDREWDRLMRTPAMDMAELNDAYMVLFGLPGIERPEVDVRLNGAVLTVSLHMVNRRNGSRHSSQVMRRVRLPWPVAPGAAPSYSLSNGVLRVRVPK